MWPRAVRRDSERKDLGAPDYAGHSQPTASAASHRVASRNELEIMTI